MVARRRRPRGTGSVYQRPDGRWCGAYLAYDITTQRQVQRRFLVDTRPEAEARLAGLLGKGLRPVVETPRPRRRRWTSLYRYFDAGGLLLYVGITSIRERRGAQHARSAEWWWRVASSSVEHFTDRSTALRAEAIAISTEHPIHNITGRTEITRCGDRCQHPEICRASGPTSTEGCLA
jgi:hypothetical protein